MRWEYSPEEWTLFERVDWRPVNLTFWVLASLNLLLLAGIGLAFWYMISSKDPNPVPFIVLIWMWIPVLIFFLISTDRYGEARKRHRIRQREGHSHKVTFNSKGLWEAGAYISLNDYPFVLNRVHINSEPPVLHFYQTRSRGRKTTSYSNKISVLVPNGHEQEAADLVQRFQTEVIQAREQAWQRLTNPPEPD